MEGNTRRSGLARKAVGLFASVATLLTGVAHRWRDRRIGSVHCFGSYSKYYQL